MDSIDYYDRYAVPYYEETVNLSMEEQLQSFMELLPENGEVLDLGCGSGRDTLFLEEEGFSVTAMDGSKRMCELAEIHTGRDVLHLRVEDMEFDDVSEAIPAYLALIMMPLTYSIANGIAVGLIAYTLIKIFTGKFKELNIITVVLSALFVIRYLMISL